MRPSQLAVGAAVLAGGAFAVNQLRQSRRTLQCANVSGTSGIEAVRRIVVVGMGFAGVSAANRLGQLVGRDCRIEVLLVDKHNYHLFYPLLYQVASGGVEPGALAYPARIIAREHGLRFLEATVLEVDVEGKRLDTDIGAIDFDALILGPGSVTNFFGMQDVMANALPLKSLHDGTRIRNRIVDSFENADRETDPERRRALLTFVIAGGGATGVELSASLSDLIYGALIPNYPGICRDEPRLILVEAKPTVVAGWDPRMSEMATRRLRDHRIDLRLNTTVAHVSPTDVVLSDGSHIAAATVIWTAGVRPSPILESLPGLRERDGRVRVEQTLQLPAQPGVFVVGDAASFTNPGDQRPLPPTAPVAISEGCTAAENAVRYVRGQRLQSFVFHSKGDLVSLGRGAAAADLFGVVFDGVPAWIARRGVYLTNLAGFRNRLLVVLDWTLVSFQQRVIASFNGEEEMRPVRPAAAERPEEERRRAA
jgi:NADH dehydrogenase